MKRQLIKIIAVATSILMLSTSVYALNLQNGQQIGGTGITGTYHDLSTTGVGSYYNINTAGGNPGGTNNRICIFCHAPHNTKEINMSGVGATYTYLPLWNHEMSTITTYKLYTTGTAIVGDPNDPNNPLDGIAFQAAGTLGQPGSVSKLCLSCHDGTVALSAYGMNNADSYLQGNPNGMKMLPAKQIGANGDLSNHHPIGFNYDTTAAADLEIAPDTTQLSAASGVRIKDVLINGNMECITCHDVHNSKNEPGAEKFLWKSDQHSHLCLTCHIKGAIN